MKKPLLAVVLLIEAGCASTTHYPLKEMSAPRTISMSAVSMNAEARRLKRQCL
ncbi:MAG: hypothetical protein IPK95_09475 [Cellvibrionales bacterium]|nr:hypothetical protein [Cellvibrionales bacterium]